MRNMDEIELLSVFSAPEDIRLRVDDIGLASPHALAFRNHKYPPGTFPLAYSHKHEAWRGVARHSPQLSAFCGLAPHHSPTHHETRDSGGAHHEHRAHDVRAPHVDLEGDAAHEHPRRNRRADEHVERGDRSRNGEPPLAVIAPAASIRRFLFL